MRLVLAAVLVALGLAATAAGAAPGSAPPNRVDPKIADGSAAKALAAARARWRRAGIGSYSFDGSLSCFCPPREPTHVVVTRGRPNKAAAREVAPIATVPRMFGLIRNAIAERFAGLTVKYGANGVPRSIGLDRDARIADEEAYYKIEHFKRR